MFHFRLVSFLALSLTLDVIPAAKIVVIYSVGSKSHFFGVKPAIEALAERGHEITLFTPFRGIGDGIRNVREIALPETLNALEREVHVDWFAMQKEGKLQMLSMFRLMAQLTRRGARETLRHDEFRRIVAERDVDLFVVDAFGNEYAYPVIELTGVPFVTHLSASPIPMLLTALGGPGEYASVPSTFTDFTDDMSFFQRLQNVLGCHMFQLIRDVYWVPQMDEVVKEEFPQAKSINEVVGSVALSIANSHTTTTFPRSLPPTVIPIGALHTRPARELPQDLTRFADESKHGFIVFTLGSFVPVSSMPEETLQCFMRVFAKLPLNVIWKWEAAVPENTPSNVLMADWIPQQDLLGHPNAKLFISHGGMMGTQEAIYHGVPILGLPFGNDQRANIVKPKRDGYALRLEWDKLDDEALFSAISHLVYDPKVKESAERASKLMRDEPMSGRDLAVYWIEHVLRNNGTKHLQLKAKDMPFYKLYLLDVVAFLLAVLFVFLCVLYVSARFALRKLFTSPVKQKKH